MNWRLWLLLDVHDNQHAPIVAKALKVALRRIPITDP